MAQNPKAESDLKPLKNAGIVGIGKTGQAIMALATTALAARSLGVTDFGFLMLIHSVVFGLSQILRFQTWQAVIRFGAQAIEQRHAGRFQSLVKFAYRLDMLAAAIGLIIVLLAMAPLARWVELPDDMILTAQIYGISIVFMILTPTPLGVLRLLDRFDLIAWQTLIAPFIRFGGTLMLFFFGGGLLEFLIVWFLSSIASRLGLQFFALRELRRHFLWQEKAEPYTQKEEGIWQFILSHNFARGLNVSQSHIGLILIGGLLGPAAAGIFRVAQQFADVLVKPVNKLLIPAIYPELARLGSNKHHETKRRNTIGKNAAMAGAGALCIFLVLVLAGKQILSTLIGADFIAAYEPMIILAFAGLVLVASFPLEPLLSASGKIYLMSAGYALALGVYILNLVALIPLYDLNGAAFASVAASIVTASFFWLAAKPLIGKR